MKKQFLLLALALIAACGVVGCQASGEEDATNKPAAEITPGSPNSSTPPTTGGAAAPGGASNLATPGAPPVGANGSPP
jgi:hypothetical protein